MEALLLLVLIGTLLGVIRDHHNRLGYAVGGVILGVAMSYMLVESFSLLSHLGHEFQTLLNLGGLLTGLVFVSTAFERSGVADWIPRKLRDDMWGGVQLLLIVFTLSIGIDNIAAAKIGAVVARRVYKGNVMVGFLAAIVLAANAGGSFSVIGDTTTTMAWLAGYTVRQVFPAIIGAIVAVLFSAFFASRAQQAHEPIQKTGQDQDVSIDWVSVGIIIWLLVAAVVGNLATGLPGVAIWVAALPTLLLRPADWHEVRDQAWGAVFLLSLVLLASLMPIEIIGEYLPPSLPSALALGWGSAIFDNIPLTALALKQGGYDVAFLCYSVGTFGSINWFASSAGVALASSQEFEKDATDTRRWLGEGWFVPAGCCLGFAAMALLWMWSPSAPVIAAAALSSH